MNLKSRVYADNTTNPTIIDYSDLVRRLFYDGIHMDDPLFVDYNKLENKYDAYCKKTGKKGCILSIVFRGENGIIESTVLFFGDSESNFVKMVNLAILDKTLKEMKETGEFRQLLGLLYL